MKKLFTLIELIVVIVVIGILAVIVVPNISSFKEDAMSVAIESNIKNLQTSIDLYSLDTEGNLPVEGVTEFEPKAIDFDKLVPKQLRGKPKTTGVLYWIDAWGKVWGSNLDSPIISEIDGGKLAWKPVQGAELYRVYEVTGYSGKENLITSSVKKSVLTLIEETTRLESTIVEQGKAYVVSTVNKKGFESAPSGFGYLGHPEVSVADNAIPLVNQPLQKEVPMGWIPIYTIDDLRKIETNYTGNYILMENLDLGVSPYNAGVGWDPLGERYKSFKGQFDGNGLVISNLYINNVTQGHELYGLFGNVSEGGTIKNLGLNNVEVTGFRYASGLVGMLGYNAKIINCYVTGSIEGAESTGGLVGTAGTSATIENSFADVDVTNSFWKAGGLVGHLASSTIKNSYSSGSVNGVNEVGGLVGDGTYSKIYSSYSTSKVSGSGYVGGLVGYLRYTQNQSYYDSYWDVEKTTQLSTASGSGTKTGKTTSELFTQNTFSNWDFVNIWTITEGTDYPKLKWQQN